MGPTLEGTRWEGQGEQRKVKIRKPTCCQLPQQNEAPTKLGGPMSSATLRCRPKAEKWWLLPGFSQIPACNNSYNRITLSLASPQKDLSCISSFNDLLPKAAVSSQHCSDQSERVDPPLISSDPSTEVGSSTAADEAMFRQLSKPSFTALSTL